MYSVLTKWTPEHSQLSTSVAIPTSVVWYTKNTRDRSYWEQIIQAIESDLFVASHYQGCVQDL